MGERQEWEGRLWEVRVIKEQLSVWGIERKTLEAVATRWVDMWMSGEFG